MSQSREPEPDDRQLVRYVLGLLPDEEAALLDEASIASDDFASRLRMVENDLVDDYVRGTLDRETRERFESYYLASPRRREHVRFATSLLRAVDRQASRADAASGGSPTPVIPTKPTTPAAGTPALSVGHGRAATRSTAMTRLVMAAALVLVVCGALAFEIVRLRNGLTLARQENAALNSRARDLQRQLDVQRAAAAIAPEPERLGTPAPDGSPAKPPSEPAAPPDRTGPPLLAPAIALVLSPQTRAIGPIPTLAIPPGTDRVRFELRLESHDLPRYRVGLRDPATSWIVWRSPSIAATTSSDQASVSVIVPARFLKPQHYSFDLMAGAPAGSHDVVGSYAFRVVP